MVAVRMHLLRRILTATIRAGLDPSYCAYVTPYVIKLNGGRLAAGFKMALGSDGALMLSNGFAALYREILSSENDSEGDSSNE